MTLEKIAFQLLNNLTNIFIHYSPSDSFKEEKKGFLINLKLDQYPIGIIIIQDKNGHPYELKDKPTDFSINDKNNIIKKNMFLLLHQKEILPYYQFDYLIDKYFEYVDFCCLFTYWLDDNLDIYFPNIEEDIKDEFTHQFNFFKIHCEELIQRFNLDVPAFSHLKKNEDEELDKILEDFANKVYEHKMGKALNFPVIETTTDDNCEFQPKRFSHFILHEKNKEIETIIVSTFKNEKGKTMRFIIEYFISIHWITLEYGKKQKLYDALKISFNRDIGSYNSVWGYDIDKNNDSYTFIKRSINIALKGIV